MQRRRRVVAVARWADVGLPRAASCPPPSRHPQSRGATPAEAPRSSCHSCPSCSEGGHGRRIMPPARARARRLFGCLRSRQRREPRVSATTVGARASRVACPDHLAIRGWRGGAPTVELGPRVDVADAHAAANERRRHCARVLACGYRTVWDFARIKDDQFDHESASYWGRTDHRNAAYYSDVCSLFSFLKIFSLSAAQRLATRLAQAKRVLMAVRPLCCALAVWLGPLGCRV